MLKFTVECAYFSNHLCRHSLYYFMHVCFLCISLCLIYMYRCTPKVNMAINLKNGTDKVVYLLYCCCCLILLLSIPTSKTICAYIIHYTVCIHYTFCVPNFMCRGYNGLISKVKYSKEHAKLSQEISVPTFV